MRSADKRKTLRLLAALPLSLLGGCAPGRKEDPHMLRVYTFGDSILDCARYSDAGVHPGQLLVRNEVTRCFLRPLA